MFVLIYWLREFPIEVSFKASVASVYYKIHLGRTCQSNQDTLSITSGGVIQGGNNHSLFFSQFRNILSDEKRQQIIAKDTR